MYSYNFEDLILDIAHSYHVSTAVTSSTNLFLHIKLEDIISTSIGGDNVMTGTCLKMNGTLSYKYEPICKIGGR